MHMPVTGVTAQHHHFEIVDPTLLDEERTRSCLTVDSSVLKREDRSGDNGSDVGCLRRIKSVGPSLEDSDLTSDGDRLTDLNLRRRYLDIVKCGSQVLQERFISGFAVREYDGFTYYRNDSQRKRTYY